jgi:hypothetical protein
MKNIGFSHIVIFSKRVISGGGVTLVPRYKMQTQFHQDLPVRHVQSIMVVRKSSTPMNRSKNWNFVKNGSID